jgi:hypothetical protein
MAGDRMNRKEFIMASLGGVGIGACMCGAALSMQAAFAAEQGKPKPTEPATEAQKLPETKPGEKSVARAAKRMEFVDGWVTRFFKVVDENLDKATRMKLMAANGKACFCAFFPDPARRAEPLSLDRIRQWIAGGAKDHGYGMDGGVITFEYLGSAETGQASPENVCLCPTAEAQKPGEISPTYCQCSVGYVKEMHERRFGRSVNVELVNSVLMNAKRCQFRITLA